MSLQNRALISEDASLRNINRTRGPQLVKRTSDTVPEQLSFPFVHEFLASPDKGEACSLARRHSIGVGWRNIANRIGRLSGSTDW